MKSSKDTISGLETEKQASVVQEEIKTLRQINETQEEKIINLTNELHAKAMKIEKFKGDLEKAYAIPESKDGEDEEWTDLGSATALRDELIKQKEKNKKMKAKFEAYKLKVAAYRTKKANEKMVIIYTPDINQFRKLKKRTLCYLTSFWDNLIRGMKKSTK